MNVAITTNSETNAKNIALTSLMMDAKIPPKCILIINKKRGAAFKFYHLLKRKDVQVNPYLDAFCRNKGLSIRGKTLSDLCVNTQSKIIYIDNLNSTQTSSVLRSYNIDYLINGGGGIFRKEVIDSVDKGVLNIHMGKLPNYRGMNALEWSLFHKEKIGVTLHYIDTGIDTGAIISFKELKMSPGDSITDLRHKSSPLGLQMLIDFLKSPTQFIDNMKVQNPPSGRQYFIMHHEIKRILEAELPNSKDNL